MNIVKIMKLTKDYKLDHFHFRLQEQMQILKAANEAMKFSTNTLDCILRGDRDDYGVSLSVHLVTDAAKAYAAQTNLFYLCCDVQKQCKALKIKDPCLDF